MPARRARQGRGSSGEVPTKHLRAGRRNLPSLMTTIAPKYRAFPKTKTAYYTRCGPEKTVCNRHTAGAGARRQDQPVLWRLLLPAALPVSLLLAAHRVVVFNLGDSRKGYFDDLAVRAFYFHAWGGECLSGFHAPDNAPHALSVNRHDLDIVFAVQWLKGCE